MPKFFASSFLSNFLPNIYLTLRFRANNIGNQVGSNTDYLQPQLNKHTKGKVTMVSWAVDALVQWQTHH